MTPPNPVSNSSNPSRQTPSKPFWKKGPFIVVVLIFTIFGGLLLYGSFLGRSNSQKSLNVNVDEPSTPNKEKAAEEALRIAQGESKEKSTDAPSGGENQTLVGLQNQNNNAKPSGGDGYPDAGVLLPPQSNGQPPNPKQAAEKASPVYETAPSAGPNTQQQPVNSDQNRSNNASTDQKQSSGNPSATRSTYYHAYYKVGVEQPVTPPAPTPVPNNKTNQPETPPRPTGYERKLPVISKPPFGTNIPVRTLGYAYSLRQNGFVRLEVTRDVQGQGWKISRGSQFVGRVESSNSNRLFIQTVGYIDPVTNRLVRFGGETVGRDGGPGLQGERKRLDSRVGYILNRLLNSVTQLGTTFVLSRRGAGGFVLPFNQTDASALIGREGAQPAQGPQFFVEVPANTQGYVMVTDLPQSEETEDATPFQLPVNQKPDFTQADLNALLSAGNIQEIEAILPRLPEPLKSEIKGYVNQVKANTP